MLPGVESPPRSAVAETVGAVDVTPVAETREPIAEPATRVRSLEPATTFQPEPPRRPAEHQSTTMPVASATLPAGHAQPPLTSAQPALASPPRASMARTTTPSEARPSGTAGAAGQPAGSVLGLGLGRLRIEIDGGRTRSRDQGRLETRQSQLSERDIARSEALVKACFASRDYEEGRKAFMEKRKPIWKDR